MKFGKTALLVLVGALVAVQFIPSERSNPPERDQPAAPPEVQSLLQRACYDCHSNETRWPWYASVAPLSFLIARDVREGRKELNFSNWNRYDERRRTRKLKEIVKVVKNGDMAPWYYVPVHPQAQLSTAQRNAVLNWAQQPEKG